MDLKFTMVMDEEAARKMSYIGKYYGRSRIKEIEWARKQYIQNFEETVDKINIEDALSGVLQTVKKDPLNLLV